ncbi:MAG: 1-phosphofructokinase family hexose kinase [Bacillota bacterium]
MITTVTLNPAIDREYFVPENKPKKHQYIYSDHNIQVSPGGKGLLSAINLKKLGHSDVQNIGFIGGKQGLFFEKMVQEYQVTTNYIYTRNEIRNNIKIIGQKPVTYTHFNDYTYTVEKQDVKELIKRFSRSIDDSKMIMISGSVPSGVNFDIYQRLIKICHQKQKEVYLQASGDVLNLSLKEKPKIVSPYFKHTDKILDKKIENDEDYYIMGRKLIEKGAEYVTLPFHCDRLLFTPEKTYRLSPENFCLINWLGAGDAYNAGFFDYILNNDFDFIEANRFGAAAALYIAEHRSIFLENKTEIEKNLSRITIKEVEENQ